jgi:hypothetical protein
MKTLKFKNIIQNNTKYNTMNYDGFNLNNNNNIKNPMNSIKR